MSRCHPAEEIRWQLWHTPSPEYQGSPGYTDPAPTQGEIWAEWPESSVKGSILVSFNMVIATSSLRRQAYISLGIWTSPSHFFFSFQPITVFLKKKKKKEHFFTAG